MIACEDIRAHRGVPSLRGAVLSLSSAWYAFNPRLDSHDHYQIITGTTGGEPYHNQSYGEAIIPPPPLLYSTLANAKT